MQMLPTLVASEWRITSKMGLTLCWADDDAVGFVTTDRPCFLFDARAQGPFPPAFGSQTAEVTMAITPRCMALVSWTNEEQILSASFPSSAVDLWNRRAIRYCAESFIVCGDQLRSEWFDGPDTPFVTLLD